MSDARVPPAALPEGITLNSYHPVELQLVDVAAAMLDAGQGVGKLAGSCFAHEETPVPRNRGELEERLRSQQGGFSDRYLQLTYSTGLAITAARSLDHWTLDSSCFASSGESALRKWLPHALSIARQLPAALPTLGTEVNRLPSAAGFFMPEPPIARMRHLWLSSDAEIAEHYGAHAPAFAAAWDEVVPCGEHKLLIRAAGCVTEPEWVENVIGHQLDLARAAHPGQTRWSRAQQTDWNRRWLRDPASDLGYVGYDAARQRIEFTAMTDARGLGIHDLQLLHELSAGGRDRQARPVALVDVVYLDATDAAPDLVPLTDLGIGALAYDRNGALVRLN